MSKKIALLIPCVLGGKYPIDLLKKLINNINYIYHIFIFTSKCSEKYIKEFKNVKVCKYLEDDILHIN